MSAIDKPLEDFYTYLKSRWWGIPMVIIAILLASAFAIWNSLPTTTKERILREPGSTPVPPSSEASGTARAKINLPAQPFALVANIRGDATADVSDNGWMELSIYVSGSDKPCEISKVYRNHTSKNLLSATATCTVPLSPNTPYEFRAEAPNYNADAQTTLLKISYSHK
jgi:hypothetical protein